MSAPIIVVGHKNPDNDAISSAVGYAYLKNELARRADPARGSRSRRTSRPLRPVASGDRLGSRERAVSPRPRSWVTCMRASAT